MVKASKFFLKEAAKAERAAVATGDSASGQLSNLAEAFRVQAEILKQKKSKKDKKK